MDEEKRARLIRAIRAFTVDMPNNMPNGEAERQTKRLCALLDPKDWPSMGRGPWVRLGEANDAAAKMCAAMAVDLRALREAAESFFGEDFGSPASSTAAEGDLIESLRSIRGRC